MDFVQEQHGWSFEAIPKRLCFVDYISYLGHRTINGTQLHILGRAGVGDHPGKSRLATARRAP